MNYLMDSLLFAIPMTCAANLVLSVLDHGLLKSLTPKKRIKKNAVRD